MNYDAQIQYDNEDMSKQRQLLNWLRQMGDPRLGGSLPLGGKASAPGGAGQTLMPQAGLAPRAQVSYPANMHPAEPRAYDHLMNMKEQELEDLNERMRRRLDLVMSQTKGVK